MYLHPLFSYSFEFIPDRPRVAAYRFIWACDEDGLVNERSDGPDESESADERADESADENVDESVDETLNESLNSGTNGGSRG